MAARRYANIACPVCLRPIRRQDAIQECDPCRQSVHADCWKASGGCGAPGCPNNRRTPSPTIENLAPPETVRAVQQAQSVVSPVLAGTTMAQGEVALTCGAADGQQGTAVALRSHAGWTRFLLVLFTAAVVVVVTLVILVFEIPARRARAEFRDVVYRARKASPRAAVEMFQHYIDTHPDNRLTGEAKAQHSNAQARIDEWDWQQAQGTAAGAGRNLESTRQAYEHYVAIQPLGAHAEEASQKAVRLSERIDKEAFQSAAAEPDLQARMGKLQAYIDQHPEAAHAGAARGLLEALPDQIEEQRLRTLQAAVRSQQNVGRLRETLAQIDREVGGFRAAARREQLDRLRSELRDAMAAKAAPEILSRQPANPSDRQKAITVARRFLAEYADSPARTKVQTQLETWLAAAEAEHIQELRRVQEGVQDPRVALRGVRDYAVKGGVKPEAPGLPSAMLPALAAYYRQVLVDAPIPSRYELTLADGSTLAGDVTTQNNMFQVVLPNGKKQFVANTKVKTVTPLPERTAAEELRRRLEPTTLTPALAEALLPLARSTRTAPKSATLCAYLAAMDPSRAEAVQEVVQAGFVNVLGAWFPKDEVVPVFGGVWIGDQWVAPEQQAWVQQRIEAHRGKILAEAERVAKEKARLLNIDIFRISTQVPLECSVSLRDEPAVVTAKPSEDGVDAEVRFQFSLSVQVVQSVGDAEVARIIKQSLSNMESRASLAGVLRLEHARSTEVGLGLGLALRDGAWVVETVVPGSAAEEAGVEPGQTLVRVGQTPVDGQLSEADLQSLLSGPAGSIARVGLLVDGQPCDVALTRRTVVRRSVKESLVIEHNLDGTGKVTKEKPISL